MLRKNDKEQIINYENSIKKSNELSMAKLNHGLTLQQMQLLAFAIYSTQQDGKTDFHKVDFERKFGLSRYLSRDAYEDSDKISSLRFSTSNLEEKKFRFTPIFSEIQYIDGLFKVEWNPKFLPHILELKDKYITTDLTITSKFKSSFSWTLYDYLKAHYGYWHKEVSKEALLNLFGVENKKTYVSNTGRFKQSVLDVAIEELKKYTEFDIHYKEIKVGRTITGFDLIWSTGEKVESATTRQIQEIRRVLDMIFSDSFKYLDLNDSEKRKRAFEILEELKTYLPQIEGPSYISKKQADILINKINMYLNELETNLEIDKNPIPPTYNWLDNKK